MAMECKYVEVDIHGNTKYCPFEDEWMYMLKHKHSLSKLGALQKFGDSVCKFCLAGQKITAINQRRE